MAKLKSSGGRIGRIRRAKAWLGHPANPWPSTVGTEGLAAALRRGGQYVGFRHTGCDGNQGFGRFGQIMRFGHPGHCCVVAHGNRPHPGRELREKVPVLTIASSS